jgi:hypothetical protein
MCAGVEERTVVEVVSTAMVPILEKISATEGNGERLCETNILLSSSGIFLSKPELGISSSGQTTVCRDSGGLIGFLEEAFLFSICRVLFPRNLDSSGPVET